MSPCVDDHGPETSRSVGTGRMSWTAHYFDRRLNREASLAAIAGVAAGITSTAMAGVDDSVARRGFAARPPQGRRRRADRLAVLYPAGSEG